MRKSLKISFNLILSLIIMLSLFPTQGFAAINTDSAEHNIDSNTVITDSPPDVNKTHKPAKRVKEIKEKRTSNTKFFQMDDGTMQAEIASNYVHYETEEGTYEDIKTKLVDEEDIDKLTIPLSKDIAVEAKALKELKSEAKKEKDKIETSFRAVQVPFDIKLPKKFKKGYSIGKGNDKLTFIPVGVNSVTGAVYGGNTMVYSDVWESTDVSLELQPNGLKETIVLKDASAPTKFRFEVDGDIDQSLSSDHFQILPAWLEDANGTRRDVHQEVLNLGGKKMIELTFEPDNLVYPINIDPTVTLQVASTIKYIYKSDLYFPPTTSYAFETTFIWHGINLRSNEGTYYWERVFLNYDTSTIPSNVSILSAKLTAERFWTVGDRNQFKIFDYDYGSIFDVNDWDGGDLVGSVPVVNGSTEVSIPVNSVKKGMMTKWKLTLSNESIPNGYNQILSTSTGIPKLVVTYNDSPSAPIVLSPNGGEIIDGSKTITWNPATDPSTPQSGLKYHIQYSTNGGAAWTDLISMTPAGVTSYLYDFSSTPATTNALVRIQTFDGYDYGPWDQSDAPFTIKHNQAPGTPNNTTPGGTTASTATLVPGSGLSLNWTFNDPDAGDSQIAYRVGIYQTSGALLSDTNWINSTLQSHTISNATIARGSTYYWNVQTKDKAGAVSPVSTNKFIKINNLPTTSLTSYADGQQITDNILTFSWTYSDADGQAQSNYQILGSQDNWTSVAFDSGVLTGSATTLTTPPLASGNWSFKVLVKDGLEWSNAIYRSNLTLPNAFEPNDTNTQAFPINYGQNYNSLIGTSTDIDFYKYTATTSGIDKVTLSVPIGLNYDVYIYDSAMNHIATSNRGPGLAENVLYEVTAGSVYYIKIIGIGGDFSTAASYNFSARPLSSQFQTTYQYDSNGNITGKTTTQTN